MEYYAKHVLEYFQAIKNPDDHFYQVNEYILQFNERYVPDEMDIMF